MKNANYRGTAVIIWDDRAYMWFRVLGVMEHQRTMEHKMEAGIL